MDSLAPLTVWEEGWGGGGSVVRTYMCVRIYMCVYKLCYDQLVGLLFGYQAFL